MSKTRQRFLINTHWSEQTNLIQAKKYSYDIQLGQDRDKRLPFEYIWNLSWQPYSWFLQLRGLKNASLPAAPFLKHPRYTVQADFSRAYPTMWRGSAKTSHHLLSRCNHVPNHSTICRKVILFYFGKVATFDFSLYHVTKNQPMRACLRSNETPAI